jgi:hypothetical protein
MSKFSRKKKETFSLDREVVILGNGKKLMVLLAVFSLLDMIGT